MIPPYSTIAAATAASNNAVVLTVSAPSAGARYFLYFLSWSYDGTPTGGRITATGLTGQDIDHDIKVSGRDCMYFPPLPVDPSAGFSATLAAGGSGVVGKVTVCYGVFPG